MAYQGDLTPSQAYDLLTQDPDAVLVDVRTRAEWSYVGTPDLTGLGRQTVLLEGPPDEGRHRGRTAGWKVAGLPWRQS